MFRLSKKGTQVECPMPASFRELLQLTRCWARLELLILPEGELAGRLARNTAKDHAIQQGVAPQAVVAMDATRGLASDVQPRDGLAVLIDALRVHGTLQATHAVVDHGGNDRHL